MALGAVPSQLPPSDTSSWENLPADTVATADGNLITATWLASIANLRKLTVRNITVILVAAPQTTLGTYTGPFRTKFNFGPAIVGAYGDTSGVAPNLLQGTYMTGEMLAFEEIDQATVYLRGMIPINLLVEGQFGIRLRFRLSSELGAPPVTAVVLGYEATH